MSLPKYKEIKILTDEEKNKELFALQKSLFELRMKKGTNQNLKPHLFHHIKRRIAQIKYSQITKEIEKL